MLNSTTTTLSPGTAYRFLVTQESAPTLDANLVNTLMRYITSSIDHLQEEEGYKKAQDKVTLHLESLFLFALVWSVGGSGADNSARHHFDGFIRAAVAEQLPAYQSPSGEKYTLPEDIPAGHVKLKVRGGGRAGLKAPRCQTPAGLMR
jgi:dynein heavy chain